MCMSAGECNYMYIYKRNKLYHSCFSQFNFNEECEQEFYFED